MHTTPYMSHKGPNKFKVMIMILLTAVLFLLVLCSCDKEDQLAPEANGQMVFFTSASTSYKWGLIFDGKELGELKYKSYPPSCGEKGFITVDALEGDHTIDFKSYSGLAWGNLKHITIESGKCKEYDFN